MVRQPFVHVLADGENTLGSGEGSDLVLGHQTVSRQHAIVRLSAGMAEIEDLGSKNGIYLNGARVAAAELRDGDQVQTGDVVFVFEVVDRGDVEVAIALPGPATGSFRFPRDEDGTRSAAAPGESPAEEPEPARDLELPDGHVVGTSAAMASVYDQLRQLRAGDIPVLICGETGVGKEHVARILHASSARRTGPFVAVNCAAIPAELLEAELFGIGAGVATGVSRREGKLTMAAGGVLFLDEIADMAPALQAKLLRALQEMEVEPVGAHGGVPIDLRVVAATNRDIDALMAEGTFRRDLYFRLSGFTLHVPPLRDRTEDIPVLAEHFLRRTTAEVSKHVLGITARALERICQAPWPGNIRELANVVRGLVYRCPDGLAIDSAMLAPALLASAKAGPSAAPDPQAGLDIRQNTAMLERRLIRGALERTGGNKAQAASLLGLSRNGLQLKMERLGIDG